MWMMSRVVGWKMVIFPCSHDVVVGLILVQSRQLILIVTILLKSILIILLILITIVLREVVVKWINLRILPCVVIGGEFGSFRRAILGKMPLVLSHGSLENWLAHGWILGS